MSAARLAPAPRPRLRRLAVVAALLALAGGLVAGGLLLTAAPERTAWSPDAIAAGIAGELTAQGLNVREVSCVVPHGGAADYRGTAVLRCGANFGDPHIPVYCGTIVDGELVTDRRVPELRC